jgi:orotidine-5'-phosphate decarboxylase
MAVLIVALDAPTLREAERLVTALSPDVRWFKVGLELFTAAGPEAVRAVRRRGARVFLDLKLHDIPATVARATAAAGRLGATLLTVHAAGGDEMLRAAASVRRRPKLVAVTTLTSLRASRTRVRRLGETSIAAGCDGLVLAPREAALFAGRGLVLVTPGIRPAGETAHDHARSATPAEAVRAGATHLVVGRPVRDARDPRAAARAILAEMRHSGG